MIGFFFSSRRRHTRWTGDWSSDVCSSDLSPGQAVNELEKLLTDRGIGGRLVRVDEPAAGLAVLSVSRDLTVWCHGGTVSWKTSDGSYERRLLSDLIDVAEQIICTHEELEAVVAGA